MNTDTTAHDTTAHDTTDAADTGHRATYSPEDNKLRIYPAHRLDADTYARVKAAGYSWAPRQELFVAPMWTPTREDLARELCGEVGDEDTSLTERAEERADRFADYSASRASDAAQARAAVESIAGRFEFGQPILIGHHSQRKAERDAERIEAGMRRAVDMWETAGYWKARAAGAIRAAKYKETPAVRARRIKGIEADLRKVEKTGAEAEEQLRRWGIVGAAVAEGKPDAHVMALHVANVGGYASQCFPLADYPRDPPASQYEGQMGLWSALDGGVINAAQAAEIGQRWARQGTQHRQRWADHYRNRLEYERAMLAEGGGLVADAYDLQPGGVVSWRGRRAVILRVNRKDGAALSVTVTGQGWTVGVEEIIAYEPPTVEAAAAVKAATAKAPLCNYPSEGCATMTAAEWAGIYADSKGTRETKATETHGAHRRRSLPGYAAVKYGAPRGEQWGWNPVFISDAKRTDPPTIGGPDKPKRKSTARKVAEAAGVDTSVTPDTAPPAPDLVMRRAEAWAVLADTAAPGPIETAAQIERMQASRAAHEASKAEGAEFAAMKEALRTGQAVQAVSAPQLFPTPAHVAARMVELAYVQPGDRVLEPSAGTGMLLGAVGCRNVPAVEASRLFHAVEINRTLADRLAHSHPLTTVTAADFLTIGHPGALVPVVGGGCAQLGVFDVVLMNPPFANAADIAHILHARRFLAPGGRLVAICAAGPRQHEALQPLADSWEYLPPGTFEGTNVRTVLLTMGGAA